MQKTLGINYRASIVKVSNEFALELGIRPNSEELVCVLLNEKQIQSLIEKLEKLALEIKEGNRDNRK